MDDKCVICNRTIAVTCWCKPVWRDQYYAEQHFKTTIAYQEQLQSEDRANAGRTLAYDRAGCAK